MDRFHPAPTLLGQFLEERLPRPEVGRRPVHLVLDLHPGYALATAPSLPHPLLVVTLNHCPLYLSDLLRSQPEGLIVCTNTYDPDQIAQALAEVTAGQRVYQGPPSLDTGLTPRERDVVRLATLGRDNQEIARELHITEKTVRNLFPGILLKLGLKDRVALCYYYLGISPDFSGGLPGATGGLP